MTAPLPFDASAYIREGEARRRKMMDAPVKLTKEAFEAEKAKLESARGELKIIEASDAKKQAHIERLEKMINDKDSLISTLYQRIEELSDLGATPVSMSQRPIKAIVAEVLESWPGITWKQVMGPRRAGHIVNARHMCIEAVCRERSDLSISAVSRVFRKDHSTIIYVVKKAHQRDATAGRKNAQ